MKMLMLNSIRQSLAFSKDETRDIIQCDLDHDQMMCKYGGIPAIQPNKIGIALLVIWSRWVSTPLVIYRMDTCDHKNMEDDSYGGPESGCMAGTCPDCGYSFHHRLY